MEAIIIGAGKAVKPRGVETLAFGEKVENCGSKVQPQGAIQVEYAGERPYQRLLS